MKKDGTQFDYDDTVIKYLSSLQPYQPLTKEEEHSLLLKYRTENDLSARNKLITSNLKWACKMANAYRQKGVNYSDILSEAAMGLIESIDKFDLNQDVKLFSYSKWWIMQKMQNILLKNNKLPSDDLPNEDMSTLNEEDESYIGNGLEESYKNEFIYEEEESDNERKSKELVVKLTDRLTDKENDILKMYYGIEYGKEFNLEDIGKKYKLSNERVRQIIEKSIKKIRSEAILLNYDYIS